jgi:phosphate starvation-inducible protein PhoH
VQIGKIHYRFININTLNNDYSIKGLMSKGKKISAKALMNKQHLELQTFDALTEAQGNFFANYGSGKSQVLFGSAGTGKTFMSLYMAFSEILNSKLNYRRIVIVRSAVATRDIGHLPGTLEEKQAVYEIPYVGICNELFNRGDAYGLMKKNGIVDFMLTSYVRGITLDETIVLVDEFQNMTAHEADSIITRLGKGSKIIFCGDTCQTDFTRNNEKDIQLFIDVLNRIPQHFNMNEFVSDDIVRSGIVKDYIKAKEK